MFAFDVSLRKVTALSFLSEIRYEKISEKIIPGLAAPFSQEFALSEPAVRSLLKRLSGLDAIDEGSGEKRNRIYVYKKRFDLLK